MHPNPIFHSDDRAAGLAFARERGFGIMVVQTPDGPLASHLPFVLDDEVADAHVPRSNAIGRHLRGGPAEALLIVSGPDGYVSPDWYGAEEQVPTWNYVAVHLRGELSLAPHEGLRAHLDRLTEVNERRLPKPVWTLDKNDPDGTAKLMRMLLPLRFEIRDVAQTWKLGQNKNARMRSGAANAMEQTGHGHEIAALASLMRGLGD